MKRLTFAVLFLLAVSVPRASAATIVVTSTADSGPGTLRQAIADAAPGDTITFNVAFPATITLTTGELLVTTSLTIAGPGPGLLTIARSAATGTPRFRVLNVAPDVNVSVAGVTLTNGVATTASRCSCNAGGGILTEGALSLSHTVIAGNTADMFGGGIFAGAPVAIADSSIAGNSAGNSGGGIAVWGQPLTVTRSTISGNRAPIGAAITSNAAPSTTLINATISGNSGGTTIVASAASFGTNTLVMVAVTVAGNTGGIRADSSAYTGPYTFPGFLAVQYANSIFAANGGPNLTVYGAYASATSFGHNISSDTTGDLSDPTDRPNTNPLLGPLQDNGGGALTMAPLEGSPAIDTGTCAMPDGGTLATDQRGTTRPQGGACDIGAFEVRADPANNLDAAVSSRASQISLDTFSAGVAGQFSRLFSSVNTFSASMATATQVTQVHNDLLGVGGMLTSLSAQIGTPVRQSDLTSAQTALTASIDSRASQTSVDAIAATMAAGADRRLVIERALGDGAAIVTLMLPSSAGGSLETVRQIVDDSITGMRQVGVNVTRASAFFARGEAALTAADYRTAYAWYAAAYQQLLKGGKGDGDR